MDANEVLKRYADGERNFRLQDLKGLAVIAVPISVVEVLRPDEILTVRPLAKAIGSISPLH